MSAVVSTIVGIERTLVHICARHAVAGVPSSARASECAGNVLTVGIVVAVVLVCGAFVDVIAVEPVACKPRHALAVVGTERVGAEGMRVARRSAARVAFVDVAT